MYTLNHHSEEEHELAQQSYHIMRAKLHHKQTIAGALVGGYTTCAEIANLTGADYIPVFDPGHQASPDKRLIGSLAYVEFVRSNPRL